MEELRLLSEREWNAFIEKKAICSRGGRVHRLDKSGTIWSFALYRLDKRLDIWFGWFFIFQLSWHSLAQKKTNSRHSSVCTIWRWCFGGLVEEWRILFCFSYACQLIYESLNKLRLGQGKGTLPRRHPSSKRQWETPPNQIKEISNVK